jgi:hypothetical protein
MTEALIEQQVARLKALLSEERAGPGLEPAEPQFSAAELSALHAVGFQTRKPDVQVSVYVFGDSASRPCLLSRRVCARHHQRADALLRAHPSG